MSASTFGSVLVTGATGIVGWNIVTALCADGQRVRVLARDVERTRAVLPATVDVVSGDLGDAESLIRAVAGYDTVFHAAGMPEQWLRDPSLFHRVNVDGTRSLVHAASDAGVTSFVYTSTIDVFAHRPGVGYDESKLAADPLPTAYERSKQLADRVVADALADGLPARFVHPAAVFGPSPTRTPGLNDLIGQLARNRLPALPPGGVPVVYAPDVARGQIRAATAAVGSRYILADRYLPFPALAAEVRRLSGCRIPPQLPQRTARIISALTEAAARVTHRSPMLPAGQLHFMTAAHQPDANRAAIELGWAPTDIDQALTATLAYLRASGTRPQPAGRSATARRTS